MNNEKTYLMFVQQSDEDKFNMLLELESALNNAQCKLDKFQDFLINRHIELVNNVKNGINDFDARDECQYILDRYTELKEIDSICDI